MKTKIISAILIVTLLFSSALVLASAEDSLKLGDINGDGRVTAMDARLVLRASAKIDELTAAQFKAADIDSNGRITAMDARAVLRASAQIEPLPEVSTESTSGEETTNAPVTETTAEATTEAPTTEAPTTEEPTTEEPTTEEPTTEEPDTGVVVSEYPDVIDTFFSGKFYLKCALGEDNDDSSVEIAANGKNYEMAAKFGEFQFNIYYYRYTTYFKNPANKTYAVYDAEAKKTLSQFMDGAELNFDELLTGFEFGKVEVTEDPVLTKGEFQKQPCDVYTFNTPNGKSAFYFIDDELMCIIQMDENGKETSAILVDELSSKIPSGMLTTSGYKKQDIMSFLLSLMTGGVM